MEELEEFINDLSDKDIIKMMDQIEQYGEINLFDPYLPQGKMIKMIALNEKVYGHYNLFHNTFNLVYKIAADRFYKRIKNEH